jgi:hypothetical protein
MATGTAEHSGRRLQSARSCPHTLRPSRKTVSKSRVAAAGTSQRPRALYQSTMYLKCRRRSAMYAPFQPPAEMLLIAAHCTASRRVRYQSRHLTRWLCVRTAAVMSAFDQPRTSFKTMKFDIVSCDTAGRRDAAVPPADSRPPTIESSVDDGDCDGPSSESDSILAGGVDVCKIPSCSPVVSSASSAIFVCRQPKTTGRGERGKH